MDHTPPVRVSRPGRTRTAIAALVALVAATGCGGGSSVSGPGGGGNPPPPARPVLPATYRPTGVGATGAVMVHLFEWRWADIATECENVLGPAGYQAVQVSPPQEHAVIANAPWWQRYQPVSYSIDRSRSGTRAEFVDMVQRCRARGVDIYVDAVINHMTAGSGTGSNGTVYTKFSYPTVPWTQADFHTPCEIRSYQDAVQVQDCELLGLSDLNTESDTVRARTARYLIELARLGVRGFRIDAAKHILPSSLDAIIGRMNATLAQEGRPLPYVFHEVIDYGGEAVRATDYLGVGYASNSGSDISEFKFRGVQDKFLRAGGTQRVGELAQFSESRWGLLPTDKAVVFLENHDTARDGTGNLSYRSPQLWRLAQVWILGQAYGYPSILSGYAFSRPGGRDLGPPSDGSGNTRPVACPASIDQAAPDGWVCEHRDPVVRTMVAFRRTVAGTDTRLLWDDGAMATAYSRGDRGFVAVNANATQLDRTIPTALPPGRYCDVLTGGRTGTTCAGTVVTIDAAGTATVQLAPLTALAIHSGTRL